MATIATLAVPATKRKAMMVVLALPCFSRSRVALTQAKKGKGSFNRRDKHQARRDA